MNPSHSAVASRALFRYIYTFDYEEKGESASSNEAKWRFHYDVFRVAQQYEVPDLVRKAYGNLCEMRLRLAEAQEIVDYLKVLREVGVGPTLASLQPMTMLKDLIPKNLKVLAQEEGFRELLTDDEVVMRIFLGAVAERVF
jgi:hypothetical protein